MFFRARDDTEAIPVQDQLNPKLWRYVTVEENGLSGTTIEALATDRPGNVASGEVEL